MALTCAVQKCSNGAYWLNKWRKELCETCGCLHKDKSCRFPPPFRLFTFPTVKKNVDRREKWKLLIGRKQGNQLWSPPKDCRVCSRHFLDGEPTVQNPLPTLHLGYNEASKRVKRMAQFDATKHMPTQKRFKFFMDDPAEPEFTATPIFEDPPIPNLTKTPMPFPPILVLIAFTLGLFNLVRSHLKSFRNRRKKLEN